MLKVESVNGEVTVQIEGVTNYLQTMAELMECSSAVIGQIAEETGVDYYELIDMFTTIMADRDSERLERIE